MTRVGLVFGGRSVEHRVSVDSARTVAAALEEAGHRVVPLGIARDGGWVEEAVARRALTGEVDEMAPVGVPIPQTLGHLLTSGAEVLFPVTHGTWGEDGCFQGLAEMLDLPYVGTGVAASAVAADKVLCKRILAAAGLPVVESQVLHRRQLAEARAAGFEEMEPLGWPRFVKPAGGGSSVGVSKAGDAEELAAALDQAFRFDDTVLIERSVHGRELECAVLGHGHIEASVIGEIVPGNDFYDYADKYLEDGAQLIAPAPMPEPVAQRLRELAVRAFEAIGGSGLARVDFFLEAGDRLWINEINTLPGFTDISMYPRLWGLTGVPLPELTDRLVQLAQRRHTERRRMDQGIVEWLAELAER